MPVWRVSQPEQAARQLAEDLKAAGAEVELRSDGAGVWLTVAAPAAAVPAVNDRLAALEMALDGRGRLGLRVQAPQ